ncbi:hypothetical protein [Streptomyces sp. NPDC059389]|uniref:hypothetical protein n=1 Tax=Streptomyces sp. NPDC059389 TaxID=3346818 RepID=UPI00369B8074
MTCRRTSSLPPDARPQVEEPAADPLTDRERGIPGAVTRTASLVRAQVCEQFPCSSRWWGSGGDRSMKALSQTSGRVNEVSVRPMDVWGEACQELLTEVAKAKKLGTIPSDDARSSWNDALGAFEHGAGECVAGTAAKDSPRASGGIREVRKGIGRLAAAMSLIRGDLEGH